MASKSEPEITKRRVTMRNESVIGRDTKGKPTIRTEEAVDYVNPEFLDAYVEDARTRWSQVEVSEEPDAGPGGYHGQTAVPSGINHPEAGTVRPASQEA